MLVLILVFLAGCGMKQSSQVLTEEKLVTEINHRSFVKLSDLIGNRTTGSVCLLQPYQDRVADWYPESEKINRYLQEAKFQADESHWALAFLDEDVVSVAIFKRLEAMDVLSLHEFKNQQHIALPSNFEAAECVLFKNAAFFKVFVNDRIYLVFGSIRNMSV